MAQFFSMANAGNDGWNTAMGLIHKVMKKESGEYLVRNVSGYIVNAAKEFWHKW